MDCTPTDDDEKKLLDAVKAVFKSNKIKYQNKKVVRAWLSEQEAAEYWYVTDDDSFWAKFWKKEKTTFGGKVKPTKKQKAYYGLRSVGISFIRSSMMKVR